MIYEPKFLPNSPTHSKDINHALLDMVDAPDEYIGDRYLATTISGIIWSVLPISDQNLINGRSDINLTFGGRGNPYWEFKEKSFFVGGRFYFKGSNFVGEPISIKYIAYMSNDHIGNIQLYDYTNAKVISEVTITNTLPQIITNVSLNNIPENEAILEIRAKSNKKGKKGYINSITVCF